jgi:hypothetical protein
MAEDNKLTPAQQAALATRPDWLEKGDIAGTEDIGVDDLRLPRLSIAQGLSPQLIPSDASHIPGLQMFDLFNDLTGEIYGKVGTEVEFMVVQRATRRIQFDPDQRGVPLDLNVPDDDPRNDWTKNPETGKAVPPLATKFVEFVILLMRNDNAEPIVLSIKETNKFNRRTIERLTGFIKLRIPPAPIYAGLYSVSVGTEKNDKGTFGVFTVKNKGYQTDPDKGRFAKAFHESLKGKTIVVNREPGDDSFDVDAMDSPSTGDRPDM